MLSGGKGSSGANVGLATKTTTPFPTKDPLGGGYITSPRTGADSTPRPRSLSAGLLKGGTPPSPNGNAKGKGYLDTPGTDATPVTYSPPSVATLLGGRGGDPLVYAPDECSPTLNSAWSGGPVGEKGLLPNPEGARLPTSDGSGRSAPSKTSSVLPWSR